MNKSLKKKWVAALRSGKYQQTDCVLKYSNGYCCLGVLREIMHPKSRRGVTYLCKDHMEEAGLTMRNQKTMSNLNDVMGYSFKRIATYIERKY